LLNPVWPALNVTDEAIFASGKMIARMRNDVDRLILAY